MRAKPRTSSTAPVSADAREVAALTQLGLKRPLRLLNYDANPTTSSPDGQQPALGLAWPTDRGRSGAAAKEAPGKGLSHTRCATNTQQVPGLVAKRSALRSGPPEK